MPQVAMGTHLAKSSLVEKQLEVILITPSCHLHFAVACRAT